MPMYKKAIVLVFVSLVVYFWISAIFSEKNSPENLYSFRSVSADGSNKPFAPDAPPPDKNQGSQGEQGGNGSAPPPPPNAPTPPQGSPVPPPPGSPAPPPGSPVPAPPEKPNTGGGGNPKAPPVNTRSISIPEGFKMPGISDLTKHQDMRLNLEIDYPKDWTIEQSEDRPEFKIKSGSIESLCIRCMRSKVMEGRSFQQEVDAIIKNETEMKKTGDLKKSSFKFEDNNAQRFDFDEFPVDSSDKSHALMHYIYVFIEHDDEAGVFVFQTPYALKDKAVPLFEKIASSIIIINRPPPGAQPGK
jgi:hypothetical protein